MKSVIVCVVAAVLMLAGCAQQQKDEAFFAADTPGMATQILEMQAARGARADGMLHGAHFDGAELNALGRQKLELMIRDNSVALPIVVHLDLPESNPETPRCGEAVRRYLTDAGLLASQFRVETGPNAKAIHAAAENQKRLPKTENPAVQGNVSEPQSSETALPMPAAPGKP